MSRATINQILRILTTTTTHLDKNLLLQRPQSTKTCEKRIEEKSCAMCKQDVCTNVKTKKKGFFGGLFSKKTIESRATKEECKIEQGELVECLE